MNKQIKKPCVQIGFQTSNVDDNDTLNAGRSHETYIEFLIDKKSRLKAYVNTI